MKRLIVIILIVGSLFSLTTLATQRPIGLVNDRRIKTVAYDPNNVIMVNAHYGFNTVLRLSKGERINGSSSIAISRPAAWRVSWYKNYVILRPMAYRATSNVTIFTNKHVYNLLLYASFTKVTSGTQTFMVNFVYPNDKSNLVLESPRLTHQMIEHFGNPSDLNRKYSFKGDRLIAPIMAEDNGTFTLLKFKKGAPIPAIFSVDPRGFEAQVNYRLEGPYVVVEGIHRQYTLRYGNRVVCLFNDDALGDWQKI